LGGDREGWLAIVNPRSGGARGRSAWSSIEAALRRAALPLSVAWTTAPGEGEAQARQAVQSGHRRILVAGGDGSVHDVVNGIMNAGLADTREVTLAVAPLGTGNDWARSLGVRRNPAAVASCLSAGRTSLHDVGLIEFPDSARTARRWFINVAGSGLDAQLVATLPALVPSGLTYLRGALRNLLSYRSPDFEVEADDERMAGRLLVAFVANGRYCGNRMHVAPGARTDDGLLELVLIEELGLARVLAKLPKLYLGTILEDPAVRHRRVESVRIDAEPATAVQADGQLVGHTPAVFSLRSRALGVVVA
jgi:YegS/Rv2252/BmrU family lipid kinase